ncbi:hypothetical protein R8Z50_22000 [Longispora sp. K20-0274]|uniref:hypothetical protein n=1 Tax=Longispora sp. K20-0274 TaxID=3088255 RepID=UPI00399A500A
MIDDLDDTEAAPDITDLATGRARQLDDECATCVFAAGNPANLRTGRLAHFLTEVADTQSYIVCHETMTGGEMPAMCGGFAARYETDQTQILERTTGYTRVPPPGAGPRPAGFASRADGLRKVRLRTTGRADGPPPVIVIAIDGVLTPRAADSPPPGDLSWAAHIYDGLGPNGEQRKARVWLAREHGMWLTGLLARGAELVWATPPGTADPTWITSRLGLADNAPVLTVDDVAGPGDGSTDSPIAAYTGARPVAWIAAPGHSDEPSWARDRVAAGHPTLLVSVDPMTGLTGEHVDLVHTWLNTVWRPYHP